MMTPEERDDVRGFFKDRGFDTLLSSWGDGTVECWSNLSGISVVLDFNTKMIELKTFDGLIASSVSLSYPNPSIDFQLNKLARHVYDDDFQPESSLNDKGQVEAMIFYREEPAPQFRFSKGDLGSQINGRPIWFPVPAQSASLYEAVEQVLRANLLTEGLADMEPLREQGGQTDIRITYWPKGASVPEKSREAPAAMMPDDRTSAKQVEEKQAPRWRGLSEGEF